MRRLIATAGFLPFITVVFVNAFVDLGHKIIIQNILLKTFEGSTQIALTALVNALILLPFVLVFTPAGFLADRFAKPKVMRVSALAAVGNTLAITVCYYFGWFWPAFALTFVLALQSAIYSPAKYGYIKELVGEPALGRANGAVQAATTVAILGGIFAFSVAFEALFREAGATTPGAVLAMIAPVGWLLVAASAIEFVLTMRLPERPAGAAEARFDWGRYASAGYLRENLHAAWSRRELRLPIIGLSIFWAISQVIVAVFPAFAKAQLGVENTVILQGTIACAGIGIIIGSLLAGRWSRGYIETGLIPVGALGIAAALFLVPSLPSMAAHAANFLALGILGGFVLVPLNALVQFNAGHTGLGRVLAASNFIQNVAMLAFLGLTAVAATTVFGAIALLVLLGVTALVAAFYGIRLLPQPLARFAVARLFAARYRLYVQGLDRLPASGGVLLLGNHVSWLDWAMIQIASPRPIRFVMDRGIYNRWYLRWLLDAFGAIPISRVQSAEALNGVRECLDAGEVVCLFPEGRISHNGHLGPFKRGFERAATGAHGVIVPFYIHGLWGSRFSRAGAGLRNRRQPGRVRDVIVGFGASLPMDTDAGGAKQAVMELSVDCWQRHARTLPSLPAAWLRTAKRRGSAPALADSTGVWLSNRRLLAAVLMFARYLRRHTASARLGILLPPGSAGTIANLAALLIGRTVVNLNYSAEPAAVRAAIERAGITDIITAERFVKRLSSRGIEIEELLGQPRRHNMEDFRAGLGSLEQLLALAAASILPAAVLERFWGRRTHPDATAAILFSSGSEGVPKGVELSHRNILANVQQVVDVLDTAPDDVVLGNLPLFHAFGLTVTTFLPAIEGIPVVCHPDPTDALGSAKAIARHRATLMCTTSSFLRLFTRNRRIQPLMLESLRLVVAGAERLNPVVREAFERRFNRRVYEGYGAT
ncbi:MAG: MFS transporter, partial [Nitrococcus sp.]|nr:MFS transporter [Nitrococcus sp.]